MSEAAQPTENGVHPTEVVDETPVYKVLSISS